MSRKGISFLIHRKSGLLWLSLVPFLIGLTYLLSSGAPPLSGQTDPLDVPFRQPLYVLHLSWTITAEWGKVKNDHYMLHPSLPDQNGVILRGAEMGRYQSGAEYFAGQYTTPRQVCEAIKGLPPAKLSAIYNVIRCPAPPPPKPAPTKRAEFPATNHAPQVSIRLSEPDESLTIGQRVTFIAEASDDKDTPQQLRYSWKAERLDTGKTVEGSTGSRNTLSWTPRLPGSARITVTVRDREGAEGQDSIEVNIEKPIIEKIEFKGAKRNKTSEYLNHGIIAARRGQYFGIDVTPVHFNSDIHNVRLFIDDERVEKGEPNPTKWVFRKAKLGKTKLGTTKIRYYVFAPSAIPIGRYRIEVALTNDETDEEMDRKALDPELAVLFNPFSDSVLEDVSVREGKPLGDNEADTYTISAQDKVFFPRYNEATHQTYLSPSGFDVSPYAPDTFKAALKFVDELSEAQKKNAEEVAELLTLKVGKKMIYGAWWDPYCLTGGSLENITEEECKNRNGKWTGSQCYLGGTRTAVSGNNALQKSTDCANKHGVWIWNPYWPEKHPGSWNAIAEICKQFTDTGEIVKYGQCFTYGVVVTALLRSVGIPARTVTTWESGHDKYPPWGVQSTFFDKNGRCLDFEVWNFHCWNEAWIPSVNSQGGWAILDATPQSRAADEDADMFVAVPGLDEVTSVPRQPAGGQYPDGQDEVFVYTECNLPATNDIVVNCEKGRDCPQEFWDPSKVAVLANTPPSNPHSATHIYFEASSGMEDNVGNYRPNASGSSPSYSAASLLPTSFFSLIDRLGRAEGQSRPSLKKPLVGVEGPKEVVLNAAFQGKVEVSNLPTDTPVNLTLLVKYFPLDFNGGAAGPEASGPELRHLQEIKITPRNRAWTGTIDIPGNVFATSGQYRWKAAVGSATEGASAEADIFVRGIPLSLALPARFAEGETVSVKAELTNTLDETISQAELHLRMPSSWQTSDPVSLGPQELAPGSELILEARVKAGQAGKFLINAEARTTIGPSYAGTEVVVVGKPDLEIDALPIQGAPVGKTFEVTAEVINDGVEPAQNIDARLAAVAGIKITSEPTQRVEVLEGKSQVKIYWKIQAQSKGIFRLPIEASLPGGTKVEGLLVIYAGTDDPEEMEAQEDAPQRGSSQEPGGAAGAESDILADFDGAPTPATKASGRKEEEAAAARERERAGGTVGRASGAGGGPAVKGSPSIPLPLLGLLALLLVNTGLVIALMMRRRKSAPAAQKVTASIEVIYQDGGRKSFGIRQARTTIGRAEDNSLVIHDPDVSSHHAEIFISDGSFILRDLGSANGTFLNGGKIQEAEVYQGDEILLGSTKLMISS